MSNKPIIGLREIHTKLSEAHVLSWKLHLVINNCLPYFFTDPPGNWWIINQYPMLGNRVLIGTEIILVCTYYLF